MKPIITGHCQFLLLGICCHRVCACSPRHSSDVRPQVYFQPTNIGHVGEPRRGLPLPLKQGWVGCDSILRADLLVKDLEPGGKWGLHASTQEWILRPADVSGEPLGPPIVVVSGLGSILYHCPHEDRCFPLVETVGTCGFREWVTGDEPATVELVCGGRVGMYTTLAVSHVTEYSVTLSGGSSSLSATGVSLQDNDKLSIDLRAPDCAQ